MLYRHIEKWYDNKEVIILELRVLNYFLAVAREESISGAANALHLSQPTLSRQLKDMEDELGKQLFIRGSTPFLTSIFPATCSSAQAKQ